MTGDCNEVYTCCYQTDSLITSVFPLLLSTFGELNIDVITQIIRPLCISKYDISHSWYLADPTCKRIFAAAKQLFVMIARPADYLFISESCVLRDVLGNIIA